MAFWNHSAEMTAKLSALDKSQAVIEFAPDGTILNANANFLAAMGYGLEEIKGRHHRIFVEPAEAESADYRLFWEKLRRGEYDSREYKRLGKGRREIWIQASYNPVLGSDGNPSKSSKVAKFAHDIPHRKQPSAEAMVQIDAIGKSQAVIHFNLDGTVVEANQNF